MILQQCTKDFQSLINQWNVIKTYEHLEESGQRYSLLTAVLGQTILVLVSIENSDSILWDVILLKWEFILTYLR